MKTNARSTVLYYVPFEKCTFMQNSAINTVSKGGGRPTVVCISTGCYWTVAGKHGQYSASSNGWCLQVQGYQENWRLQTIDQVNNVQWISTGENHYRWVGQAYGLCRVKVIFPHDMDYKLSTAVIFMKVDIIADSMNTFWYEHEWENFLLWHPTTRA